MNDMKHCGTCRYIRRDTVQDGFWCNNINSEYCTDWIEYKHRCDEWEGKDD